MPLNAPTQRNENDGRTVLIDASETVNPTTAGVNSTGFKVELLDETMFYLKNTTDRTVTLQAYAARPGDAAFADPVPVGGVVTLSPGNVTATRDSAFLTDHHGYVRWLVTASASNPTVGSVEIRAAGKTEE